MTYPNDARSDLVTGVERSAILAGLRLLQRQRADLPEDIYMILTDRESDGPLCDEGINQLCEEINHALTVVLFTE